MGSFLLNDFFTLFSFLDPGVTDLTGGATEGAAFTGGGVAGFEAASLFYAGGASVLTCSTFTSGAFVSAFGAADALPSVSIS